MCFFTIRIYLSPGYASNFRDYNGYRLTKEFKVKLKAKNQSFQ